MASGWPVTRVHDRGAFNALRDLQGKRWAFRGQPRHYSALSIERGRTSMSRLEVCLERRSIDTFRYSARFFAHPGEEPALRTTSSRSKCSSTTGSNTAAGLDDLARCCRILCCGVGSERGSRDLGFQ
jgi:hypothetical protein